MIFPSPSWLENWAFKNTHLSVLGQLCIYWDWKYYLVSPNNNVIYWKRAWLIATALWNGEEPAEFRPFVCYILKSGWYREAASCWYCQRITLQKCVKHWKHKQTLSWFLVCSLTNLTMLSFSIGAFCSIFVYLKALTVPNQSSQLTLKIWFPLKGFRTGYPTCGWKLHSLHQFIW